MMNKKIAFKPHKTRGQEIIKIFENRGFRNPSKYDGNYSENITKDYAFIGGCDGAEDCIILTDIVYLENIGYKIYTLEEYEKLEKTAQDFAVDVLIEKRDCYFDDLDVKIVAEAYIAGYDECNQNGCLETKPKMVSIDKVKEWLKYNFFNSHEIDCYGCFSEETEVTSSFDTVEQLLENFEKTMKI